MDSIGSFFQKLLVILQKFWSDVVNGPQTLWQLTDGYPISRKILIGGAILAAVTILSLLIYYLSCIVRKKRENPMALIIVLAMVCAVFVLGARMKPSEAAPVTVDGVEILSCDSYSLSRGRLVFFPKGSVFFFEDSWFLADDTFSWMADDSTLVQLTGLRSLCSERIYTLDSADRGSGVPGLHLLHGKRFSDGRTCGVHPQGPDAGGRALVPRRRRKRLGGAFLLSRLRGGNRLQDSQK